MTWPKQVSGAMALRRIRALPVAIFHQGASGSLRSSSNTTVPAAASSLLSHGLPVVGSRANCKASTVSMACHISISLCQMFELPSLRASSTQPPLLLSFVQPLLFFLSSNAQSLSCVPMPVSNQYTPMLSCGSAFFNSSSASTAENNAASLVKFRGVHCRLNGTSPEGLKRTPCARQRGSCSQSLVHGLGSRWAVKHCR